MRTRLFFFVLLVWVVVLLLIIRDNRDVDVVGLAVLFLVVCCDCEKGTKASEKKKSEVFCWWEVVFMRRPDDVHQRDPRLRLREWSLLPHHP